MVRGRIYEAVFEVIDGLAASAEERVVERGEEGNPKPHLYGYNELMLRHSEAEVRVRDCLQPCARCRRCNGVLIFKGG